MNYQVNKSIIKYLNKLDKLDKIKNTNNKICQNSMKVSEQLKKITGC